MDIANTVFKVNTSSGSGSGFYLKDKNIFITNFHVVSGYQKVSIEDHHKNRYLADVVFINPEVDIALLIPKVELETPIVKIEDIMSLQSRDRVFVLGFPFGMPFTVTEGIVSSPRQLMEGRNYIQTDASVNPGNSGGPVINENGIIVGIITSKFKDAANMGFAIPVDVIKEELESFEQNTNMLFALKCNSCKCLIYEKTEYCNNCGNLINTKAFDEVVMTKIEAFVESAIRALGIDPILARAGYEFWSFHQGSALIRIFIFNENYLFAESPLNQLPTSNLDNLYNYLLKNPVPPFKLGVFNNQIYLAYRVHLSDVFSECSDEVKKNLGNMLLKADELDNFFVNEFGCSFSGFAKEV